MPELHWGPRPGPDGTLFRLWAPACETLTLSIEHVDHPMERHEDGWFSVTVPARTGDAYGFTLPDGQLIPDPAAHAQIGDVHGRSEVYIAEHEWEHAAPDTPWEAAVVYECHIGTFTREGTYAAAQAKLDHLVDLGVTVLELMPVAQWAGDRGWGYDGVLLYAPHPAYGSPDDLRALIDAAHGKGLLVVLDVIYNHFGPEGCYLSTHAPKFFDAERHTPWGAGIDYTEESVRRFFVDNAVYWLREFRFDGLRLDAIDHIHDASDPELLMVLGREVRARVDHPVHLMTEDNRNVTYLHERPGGVVENMTAEWNDDWHHCAHVLGTGETEGYYGAFAEDPAGLMARAMASGYSFQGHAFDGQASQGAAISEQEPRGVPSGHLPPQCFVDFLQNHDQVGNRAIGERIAALAEPAAIHALQAALLLGPHVPLLFMGEEYGETRPFLFFADFHDELGRAVTEGRRREFAGFMGHDADEVPDPIDIHSFRRSKLDWNRAASPEGQAEIARVRELLALRRTHVVPFLAGMTGGGGTVVDAPKGCVAVDWRLDGATLRMRANFTGAPVEMPMPEGAPFHLTGDAPGAPHSAAFWSEPA